MGALTMPMAAMAIRIPIPAQCHRERQMRERERERERERKQCHTLRHASAIRDTGHPNPENISMGIMVLGPLGLALDDPERLASVGSALHWGIP